MRRCSSTTSGLLRVLLDLIIISLALLALLPAKKLVVVETSCLDDQIQAAQDEADSVALVYSVAGPQVPGEVVYLIPDGAIRFDESPFVSSHCYRGPPVLS
jgi:hypothetical protein